MNKDGICLLGQRPIDPTQRIIIFKHRDGTEVSKILRKFKGDMTFFLDVLCLSQPYVLNACLAKAQNNYLTNTPKSENACFNLNHEANYRPQSVFDDRTEC